MFRGASKGVRRPSVDNTVDEPPIVKHGNSGPATTLMGGTSAAWTRSFNLSQYVDKRAPLTRGTSGDDLLANIDQDLLNPAVDEIAWNAAWYAGKVTNSQVIQALKDSSDGAFIIRDSSTQPGSFALSFRHNGVTHHVLIHSPQQGTLQVAKCPEVFACLSDVVTRFSENYQPGQDEPHVACRLNPELAVALRDLPSNHTAEDSSGALLSKMDEGGNLMTMSAHTGVAVSASSGTAVPPPLPSRTEKPSIPQTWTPGHGGATSVALAVGTTPTYVKAGVILCPHCNAKQSVKNLICSSCNTRLDAEVPDASTMRRRSSTKEYGIVVTKSKSGPAQIKELPQEEEKAEQQSAADVLDQARTMSTGSDEAPGVAANAAAPKGKAVLEIVMQAPPPNLAPILLCSPSGRRPSRHSKGDRIAFDEDNLKSTRRESLLARGISSRVDEVVDECALYLGSEIAQPNQAADKLRGASPGTFVTYDGSPDEDELILSFVAKDGNVRHGRLLHCMDGMFLVLPPASEADGVKKGPHFERLSHLLLHYAGEGQLLSLTDEQRAILQELDQEEEAHHHKQGTTGKGHQGPYRELKLDDSWYRAEMSRAEAVAFIEFEPNGTFVVRDNLDEKGHHVLSYVFNGSLHHHAIEPCKDGVRLADSKNTFSNLPDLVQFYGSTQGEASSTLKCRLRLPKVGAPAAGAASGGGGGDGRSKTASTSSSSSGSGSSGPNSRTASHSSASLDPQLEVQKLMAERPLWMQTSQPKAQALQILADRDDGAFVIRTSESRPDCYVLSYKFRNQVHHELIKVRVDALGTVYFLSSAPNSTFTSLQALLTHYEQPRPELKYPLQPALMTARSGGGGGVFSRRGSSRRGSSRRSSRSSTNTPARSGAATPVVHDDIYQDESQLSAPPPPPRIQRGGSRSDGLNAPPAPMIKRASSRMVVAHGDNLAPVPMSRANSRHAIVGRAGERLDQRAALSNWCCLNLSREEAMAKLPQKEGAFIVRRSDDNFGTLTLIANGKAFHAQIEDTTQGLHLKKSSVYQPNLSALIAYYKIPTQSDLPRCLIAW